MDCVAGIVLYNPDIKRLEENINSVINQVNEIILIDNCSRNLNSVQKILEQYSTKKIKIIKNETNFGIALALNQIMEYAAENNYDWCLTLDQDSVVPDNIISEYSLFFENYDAGMEIGILCPEIDDINKVDKVISEKKYEFKDKCITSGSLTSISAWEYVNRFDEIMFIDEVDHDFCYRLRQNNYAIVQLKSVILKHEIGNIIYKNILGLKVKSMNHSAFRKYYIARNIIYIDLKYGGKVKYRSYIRLLKQLVLILLIEYDKIEKTKNFFRGYRDAKKMLERVQ